MHHFTLFQANIFVVSLVITKCDQKWCLWMRKKPHDTRDIRPSKLELLVLPRMKNALHVNLSIRIINNKVRRFVIEFVAIEFGLSLPMYLIFYAQIRNPNKKQCQTLFWMRCVWFFETFFNYSVFNRNQTFVKFTQTANHKLAPLTRWKTFSHAHLSESITVSMKHSSCPR